MLQFRIDTGRSTEFVTCTNGAFGVPRDVRGINTDDAATTTAIATGWSIVRTPAAITGGTWSLAGTWWYLHSWLDCRTDMWAGFTLTPAGQPSLSPVRTALLVFLVTRGINTDDATTAIATGWSIVRSAGSNYWGTWSAGRDLVVPTQLARLLH